MRAMDKNPARRYQQAGLIGDDVTRISGANKRKPTTTNGVLETKRSPLKPLLALAVAAVLVLGGRMLWQGREAGPPTAASSKVTLSAATTDAAPKSSPYPAGKWVKLFSKLEDLPEEMRKAGSGVTWDNGHLHFDSDEGGFLHMPPELKGNYGARATFDGGGDGAVSPGSMRRAICIRKGTSGDFYQLVYNGGDLVCQRKEGGKYPSIFHLRQVGSPALNRECRMEFIAVGDHLISRLGSDLVKVATDPAQKKGIAYIDQIIGIRDVEVINLDGISEAEALKLAGVDSAVPLQTVDGEPSALPAAKPGRLRAAGTTANGKPHDLAKFAAYDDFVDVAGGWGRWVALRANGQTVSSDGRVDFTGIAKIASSFNSEYAFITSAGKLVIPDYEVWSLPSSLGQGVVDAALGMQHGIALLEGGRAVVFGARYEGVVGDPSEPKQYGTPRWPEPEAHALEKVKAVAATVTHAATLHEDGTLSLWGWEGPLKWEADPRQQKLRQLRSIEDGFWALDEAGQLWHLPVPRNPAPGQPVHVTGKPTLSQADVTHMRSRSWCRKNGEWAAHINTKDGMALMKEAGISESTAFSLSGGTFDGKPFASLLWIELEAEAPAQAAPSAFKGRLRGSGFHLDGEPLDLKNAEGITDFVQVILTDRGWVGLRANGEQVSPDDVWSSKNQARLLPGPSNTFAIIDREGRLKIGRMNNGGVSAIPEDVQRIGVVDACWEDGQAIALLKDGSVRVWGEHYTSDYEGPKWPAPPAEALRDVRKIALMRNRAATLRRDGKWFVWGGQEGNSGPFDLEPFQKWGEIADIATAKDAFRVLTRSGQVYNLGGSRPLASGLVAEGIEAISDHLLLPKGSPVWTWNSSKSRASAQAEVDALLQQIGNRPRGAFDLRVVGEHDASNVAAVWIEPVEAEAKTVTPTISTATKDAPFVNSLGMKFVPVPITGGPTGGQRVLFSIWETRVQDFKTFSQETKLSFAIERFAAGPDPTHPAVTVTWDEAQAFCAWLTERERKAGKLSAGERYRLPSDHEWSCAVGIGDREDAALFPREQYRKLLDVHPWGTAWPPPERSGNFASEELRPLLAAGKHGYIKSVITGYRDGHAELAPVGSYPANALGLHDLAGNALEWCEDWFDSAQDKRVDRGAGSWSSFDCGEMRSARRGANEPGSKQSAKGFRVVLASSEPAAASGRAAGPPAAAVPPQTALGGPSALPPPSAPPPFTDREAAEWVLGLGQDSCYVTVRLFNGGKVTQVKKLADLPAEPFVVQELRCNPLHTQTPEHWQQVTDAVVLRLAGLKSLKIVDLRGNMTGASLKIMAHHPGLESLLFEGQNLKAEDLRHLHASRLQSLIIPMLRVADPDSLAALASMPNLRTLWFDGSLDPAIAAALPKLPKLEILRANNSATLTDDVLPLLVERFPQVTNLQLWGAKNLKGSTLGSLTALKSLTILGLTDTLVNDEALAQIAGMPQLLTLDLGQTRITDACLPTLKSFPKLESLQIFQTELTDAALLELASIRTLKKLGIKVSGYSTWKPKVTFTDAGIAAFQKLRPEVQVVK